MDPDALQAADWLLATPRAFAAEVVEHQMTSEAESLTSLGAHPFAAALADTEQRLRYLAEAVAVAHAEVFVRQLGWELESLERRGLERRYVGANLRALLEVSRAQVPTDLWPRIEPILHAGIDSWNTDRTPTTSYVAGQSAEARLAQRFLVHALEGRGDLAQERILAAAGSGMAPAHIAEAVVAPALLEIGRLWQLGEASIADEHLCSRAAERALAALAGLTPRAASHGRRVATLSIGGELHDIGLRLVADAFESAGWSVLHLGANMPGDHLMQLLHDPGVDLLAVAVTIGLHLRKVARLIEQVRADREFDRIAILVGGAALRGMPELYRTLGADGTANSSRQAVEVGWRIVEARRTPTR